MTDTSTRPDLAAVIARSVAELSVPKAAPADSFVLHAPLELMARVRLLSYIPVPLRGPAVERIDWLREQYAAAGEPVEPPAPSPGDARPELLLAAVARGDRARVDELAAAWLPTVGAAEVAGALGEAVVPSLAAAGHAPIGLALLLRRERTVAPLPTTLLRGPLRELAAHPDWRIDWHHGIGGQGVADGLYDALRAASHLGEPGSNFIFPLMTQAQQPGVADRLLGPVLADRYDVPAATRTITRVAAWSMIHDDPAQAPYGWSHALTMPQGVMSLAGAGVAARTALAVAATHLLGFRVAYGTNQLPARIEPTEATTSAAELAAAASTHEDAHLVKYTLACLHAAADDPAFAGLHLRAAASLAEWWRTHG
jgi:hypothetical protein